MAPLLFIVYGTTIMNCCNVCGSCGLKISPAQFYKGFITMERVLILSADHYSLTSEKTGEVSELYQAWYVSDYREASDTGIGSKPIKIVIESALFDGMRKHELPAVFDIDTRSKPGKAGVASLTIVGAKYAFTPPLFAASAPAPAKAA